MTHRILWATGLLLAVWAVATAAPAQAAVQLKDHVEGSATAPITVIEYASLTCSHCSDFYTEVKPQIEEKYIKTGKVKFIYRDYPIDGVGLKAAALARCMPDEQYFPFIKILFNNQKAWIGSPKPLETILKYAEMSGLPSDKAKACLEDTDMMDAIAAQRTEATDKFDIKATPTFIFNDGEEKILGMTSFDKFASTLDKLLAKKK